MKLPLIDYFANGPQTIYRSCEQVVSADGNMTWKPTSPVEIKNHAELAELAINHDGAVEMFVNGILTSAVMQSWRTPMGSRIPPALNQHQKGRGVQPHVDAAINAIGATLSAGQNSIMEARLIQACKPMSYPPHSRP